MPEPGTVLPIAKGFDVKRFRFFHDDATQKRVPTTYDIAFKENFFWICFDDEWVIAIFETNRPYIDADTCWWIPGDDEPVKVNDKLITALYDLPIQCPVQRT